MVDEDEEMGCHIVFASQPTLTYLERLKGYVYIYIYVYKKLPAEVEISMGNRESLPVGKLIIAVCKSFLQDKPMHLAR